MGLTHDETGTPRVFEQLDYILVPPEHAHRVGKAQVQRRATRPSVPDGSDHDLVVCEAGWGA